MATSVLFLVRMSRFLLGAAARGPLHRSNVGNEGAMSQVAASNGADVDAGGQHRQMKGRDRTLGQYVWYEVRLAHDCEEANSEEQ